MDSALTQEILHILHTHRDTVVAVFAGHDHDGGVADNIIDLTLLNLSVSFVLNLASHSFWTAGAI